MIDTRAHFSRAGFAGIMATLVLFGAGTARAADPASGELGDEALKLEWTGSGPFLIPNVTPDAGEPICPEGVPQFCDHYALNVNISEAFRELPENQRESVRISIDFPVTTPADFEIYVYNASGALVAEASSAPGIVESVVIPLKTLKNGAYTVTVVPYLPLGTNYTGVVQVGKDAKAAGFSLSPQSGSAPLTVTLDARALSANPPAGGYVFEFGDGAAPVTDADGVIEHTYQANGEYLSRVRFSDAAGSKGLVSAAQTVFVGELADIKSGANRMGGAFGLGALLTLAGFAWSGRRRR